MGYDIAGNKVGKRHQKRGYLGCFYCEWDFPPRHDMAHRQSNKTRTKCSEQKERNDANKAAFKSAMSPKVVGMLIK